MRYVDGKPHSIDTVVLSSQHSPDQMNGHQDEGPLLRGLHRRNHQTSAAREWLQDTKYLINPTGRFVMGGPAGVTVASRVARSLWFHGGACLTAAALSAARTQQGPFGRLRCPLRGRNIVAAGLARQCQIQVAYAIGVARPMNIPGTPKALA